MRNRIIEKTRSDGTTYYIVTGGNSFDWKFDTRSEAEEFIAKAEALAAKR